MKEFYNIEYIPTGLIYPMHKEDVDRLVTEEPENFRVIDKDYNKPEALPEEPSTYELVVEKEEPKEKAIKKTNKKK